MLSLLPKICFTLIECTDLAETSEPSNRNVFPVTYTRRVREQFVGRNWTTGQDHRFCSYVASHSLLSETPSRMWQCSFCPIRKKCKITLSPQKWTFRTSRQKSTEFVTSVRFVQNLINRTSTRWWWGTNSTLCRKSQTKKLTCNTGFSETHISGWGICSRWRASVD